LLVDAVQNEKGPREYYDVEQNIEQIKSSTMLLPRELFREKDLDNIGDKYDYPFEISNYADLNKAVLALDDRYVYPKIIWSPLHKYYGWITISARTGAVLSFMSFGGIVMGNSAEADELLKPKQLNDALSKFMQKVNKRYK
jgi:hypothetical protein